jgi:hypothetical protein
MHQAEEAGVLNRILFDAIQESNDINHVFGVAGRGPLISKAFGESAFRNSFMQFKTFGPKQVEAIAAMGTENAGMFMRYLMASGFVSKVAQDAGNFDVEDYVGTKFVGDVLDSRALGAPAIELAKEMFLAFSAFEENNPVKTQEHMANMIELGTFIIPGALAAQELSSAITEVTGPRSEKGETFALNSRGDKLVFKRPIGADRKDLGGALGLTKDSDSEMLPMLLGSKSVTERMFSTARSKAKMELAKDQFKVLRVTNEFRDMIVSGSKDSGRLTELMKEAAEAGVTLPSLNKIGSVEAKARYLEEHLRLFLERPSDRDINKVFRSVNTEREQRSGRDKKRRK